MDVNRIIRAKCPELSCGGLSTFDWRRAHRARSIDRKRLGYAALATVLILIFAMAIETGW